jgi:hypothetical protein
MLAGVFEVRNYEYMHAMERGCSSMIVIGGEKISYLSTGPLLVIAIRY